MSLVFTNDKSILAQVMAWAIRQQTITWTSVDQRHMASLGHSDFIIYRLIKVKGDIMKGNLL